MMSSPQRFLDGGTAVLGSHLVFPDPGAYTIDRRGPDCSQEY
jgi:hypothetical protein